LLCDVGLL